MRQRWWWGGVIATLLLGVRVASAQTQIVLDEVLGSWQGDDRVQFVELRMTAPAQQLANVAAVFFDDATASGGGQRVFFFQQNVNASVTDARILLGTLEFQTLTGITPDFVIEPGVLAPHDGRVCYGVVSQGGVSAVDCVAYGAFTGGVGGFGKPSLVTPDNRSLQRVSLSGQNRTDWAGALTPTPTTNGGGSVTMQSLCGDGVVSQGETCDGDNLADATCASLGFAKGKLKCDQCHVDTRKCTFCGNGEIQAGEECDGDDLGGRSCTSLGFTGGTLSCTDKCKVVTSTCDATFFVPGGGSPRLDCLLEWRVMNAQQRPTVNGKAVPKQRCRLNDTGCDTLATPGACTMSLALCLGHDDPRLPKCAGGGVGSVTLFAPAEPDAAASALLSAVASLGTSTTADGTVTFTPALGDDLCTAAVGVVVPVGGKVVLKARATGAGGRPQDPDRLRLQCVH